MVATTGSFAAAQTFTGGLRGAVKDANGVIPGVTVELINEATNAPREAVSNESGEYSFAAVAPGTYTVRATLTGFRTYENKGVRIGTQQFVTLDITLEVGQLQETITVTGAAPLIDTSNASTGAVIDSQQLATLPSGGRSAFLFAVTVPTVVASGDSQFNRQQDQTNASLLSLGGGTRRGQQLPDRRRADHRPASTAPPPTRASRRCEDVNVQVHTYDAETGRTGGGTFNVATKSGTNEWHGSGFYQTRPELGPANNYFARRRAPQARHLLPHRAAAASAARSLRNRTFFWAAAEGYGSNTTRNAGNLRLPTAREKAGDFSQTFNQHGQLVVIYDPLDRRRQRQRPHAVPRQRHPGQPHQPGDARDAAATCRPRRRRAATAARTSAASAEIEDRAMMYTGKVDHRFTDALSLTGFYLYNKTDEPCANYWSPGRAARIASPIQTTTCSSAGCTCWR